jgi:hypothetical protein
MAANWRRKLLFACAFVLFPWVPDLPAQVETARITGTIRDQSGGLVSGARVAITNVQTNISSETMTREDGSFESVPLRIGEYRVAVEAPGFKRAVRTGLVLQIQQTAVLDFTVELGEIAQEVSVTAQAPLLTTNEPTQGQVIDNQKIVDLPLNGRDYQQLALLSAGANQPAPGARVGGFSGSGMRATQSNYLLDGVDNNNGQIAYQGRQAEVVRPNIDAIQEFKVMTNVFSAEYGRATGAVVNVSLKSGSNEFHGTAFEFLRNEKLDAKNFFDRPDAPRAKFKRNQFGFSAGGPVVRNKTFFFGDYEWTKIRESRTVNATIPTRRMVQGDFSELLPGTRIYDPLTYNAATGERQPFPDNIIPSSRLDPVGAKVASFYPEPNLPGLVRNYGANPPDNLDRDRWDARIDHHFGPKDTFYSRYSYQRDFEPFSPTLPPPAFGAGAADAGNQTTTGHGWMANYNHVFTPMFVLSSKVAWNRIFTTIVPVVDRSLNAEIGLRGVNTSIPGMAAFNPSGYTSVGLGTHLPNNADSQNRQVVTDFTWIRDRHTLKYGINFSWLQNYLFNPQEGVGVFPFDGSYSRNNRTLREGNSVADLLLGFPFQALTANNAYLNQRAPFYDFYVQEEWRATRNLTLNLGLRYELHLPWVETRNGWANFDIDTDPANPSLVVAKDGSRFDRSTIRTDANDFAPRFGFAYKPASKMVVRGGIGVYYTQYEAMGGGEYLQTNPPFHFKALVTTDRLNPTISLVRGLPEDLISPENASNIRTSSYDRNLRRAYSYQWNINLQRELPGDMILEIGYFANAAHKLMRRLEGNFALPGPGDINARRRYQSILVPGSNVIISPLSGNWRHEASSNANFHSLQTRVEKRLSRGLSLLGSYMWSKTLSDARGTSGAGGVSAAEPQDPLNQSLERSHADEHFGHRFVTSYVYDLPLGRGRSFMSSAGRWAEGVFGGWTIAGITTLSSGRTVNLTVQGNPSNSGNPDRPNVIKDWRLPENERSLERWFDTSAFVRNDPFTYGNAGRNLIEGPGTVNFDLAVYKHFALRESVRLQFRAEAFNVMNTPQFGIPNTQLGNPTFGVISSAERPRNLQFGLKILF